jgi:hypothetical protein
MTNHVINCVVYIEHNQNNFIFVGKKAFYFFFFYNVILELFINIKIMI